MSSFEDVIAKKKAQIEAAKAKAKAARTDLIHKPTTGEKIEFINPEDASNKIRVIFDNSGSMGSLIKDKEAIEHAKDGCVELLRSSVPNRDAYAIHLLNTTVWGEESNLPECIKNSTLMTDLVSLASAIADESVKATGGTPLFEKIKEAQKATPSATRFIAFSDGEPNNFINEAEVISTANVKETPIDTVFFGSTGSSGARVMKNLADKTRGIFLLYDPSKPLSFKDLFKYLSPGKRLMLMNAEFKAKLERGEIRA